MNTFKMLLASVVVFPALAAITSDQADAQVYVNYNYCPAEMVRSYDSVYQDYVCSYPANFGFSYYRPDVSVGVYWGSLYRPYRYPAYQTFRYPYSRYSHGYYHHLPHGHRGRYR